MELRGNAKTRLSRLDIIETLRKYAKLNTKPTIVKKDSKSDKNKKISPPTPKPAVVTVPSRRPKVDPRIIQKGLEYIDKIEDKEKREYILNRLERLQSGQEKIDRKIDSNERKRQYDERRREK